MSPLLKPSESEKLIMLKPFIGHVRAYLIDRRTGRIIDVAENTNLFLAHSGLLKAIQWGHLYAGKTIRYIGVGTGRTAPVVTDVSLEAEVIRSEIDSFDNTDIDDSSTPCWVAEKLWSPGDATGNITEVALFTDLESSPATGFAWFRALLGQAAITAATKTNPVVVTAAGHGRSDGDQVLIESVGGMTQLNGNKYYVKNETSPAGSNLELYSDSGLTTPVNGTGYSTYTSGGKLSRVLSWTAGDSLGIEYTISCPV